MKFFFLGTSSGVPTLERNVTCTLLLRDINKGETSLNSANDLANIWIFDCGEGTQHQFLKSQSLGKKGISFNRIAKIFITHLHGDHCFGVPGLLAMCSMKKCIQDIEVIGPVGIKNYIETCLQTSQTFLPFCLTFTEISKKEDNLETIIGQRDEFYITAFPLQHRVECFGYILKEKDKEGSFTAEKAIKGGIPKELINDFLRNRRVIIEDKTYHIKDYLGDSIPGRKFVILGDTSNSDLMIEAARDCEVLIHECTFHNTMEDIALKSMHSTSSMVARFASKVMPKNLIITHFSMRYTSIGVSPNVDNLLDDTKAECPNSIQVFAADDFWSFDVGKKSSNNKKEKKKANLKVDS